jgi:hypothetical protein
MNLLPFLELLAFVFGETGIEQRRLIGKAIPSRAPRPEAKEPPNPSPANRPPRMMDHHAIKTARFTRVLARICGGPLIWTGVYAKIRGVVYWASVVPAVSGLVAAALVQQRGL